MNYAEFELLLSQLEACKDAREWAKGKSFEEVWTTCHRGDWMLWLFHRMEDKKGWGDLRNKTLAKVRCVRLVEHLLTDERSKNALVVAQKFAEGTATREELSAADADATAAAASVAAYYASDDASAYAAAAASVAAAYVAAASVADAAASAASVAAAAARESTLLKCANICRETLITPLNIHKA